MSGILYIVPTPIGNLEDITIRALNILKKVSAILAEDTRRTSILLRHYNIKNTLISFHEYSQKNKTPKIIEDLKSGLDLAIVSDAGAPLIADPGSFLIREAIKEEIKIISLPGSTAVISALTLSGFDLCEFIFLGFLPKKEKQIIKKLNGLKNIPITTVFFESPKRLKSTLNTILYAIGDRRVVICRELTKMYEEIIRGKISEVIPQLKDNIKGEITFVMEGIAEDKLKLDDISNEIARLLKRGESVSKIAMDLHRKSGLSKKSIYNFALKLKMK